MDGGRTEWALMRQVDSLLHVPLTQIHKILERVTQEEDDEAPKHLEELRKALTADHFRMREKLTGTTHRLLGQYPTVPVPHGGMYCYGDAPSACREGVAMTAGSKGFWYVVCMRHSGGRIFCLILFRCPNSKHAEQTRPENMRPAASHEDEEAWEFGCQGYHNCHFARIGGECSYLIFVRWHPS